MKAPVIFGQHMRKRVIPAFHECWRLYGVEVRSRSAGGHYEAAFQGESETGLTPQGAVDRLLKALEEKYYRIKTLFDGDP